MHIVDAFFQLTSIALSGVKSVVQPSGSYRRVDEETDGLVARDEDSSSLTGDFEDFSHSSKAISLCLLHAFVYYSCAVLAFSFLLDKWTIRDSLYYATVSFTTIGYGDVSPPHPMGRLFHIGLSCYGIVVLGIFLGIAGEALVEGHRQALDEQRKQMHKHVVDSLVRDGEFSPNEASTSSSLPSGFGFETSLLREIWTIFLVELPLISVVILVGIIVGFFEGWSVIDSLYWTIVSGTTVGFGDVAPKFEWTRLLCVIFLPVSVAVLGHFLAQIASAYMKRNKAAAERKFLSRSLTLCDIRKMDTDKDGQVSKAEFLAYMLVTLQKVDKEELDDLLELFHRLDRLKTGYLSKEDLIYENKLETTLRGSLMRNASVFMSRNM